MIRRILIDTLYPGETRVAVLHDESLEEFFYETSTKAQRKGNIYLAKVVRVEPSLQAAFVDYGESRNGFLAFPEIHPDYYRIPVSDRTETTVQSTSDEPAPDAEEAKSEEESVTEPPRYKMQEVIKVGQIFLVQMTREERGNKGAALTTYISLAGRYCVLMPNSPRKGGVSRKITSTATRKRLKSILADVPMPEGMSAIVRTAGEERSRADIKRDLDFLFRTWDSIREKTLESTAPLLIHEEATLIKRVIRDLYARDVEEVLVSGAEGYKAVKAFMRSLIPSHARKVRHYKNDNSALLFHQYNVEEQLAFIRDPKVLLPSGGSLVIEQTEALVSIDVNSGRSTRERHIEETALKTNLEATGEIARQLRLRDLAGIVVVDFIDMRSESRKRMVEQKFREALQYDHARVQLGGISSLGLLEMSRQRLSPSLLETMNQTCPTCCGLGSVPSVSSTLLAVLRRLENLGAQYGAGEVVLTAPEETALQIFNEKRSSLEYLEATYGLRIKIALDPSLMHVGCHVQHEKEPPSANGNKEKVAPSKLKQRRRRRGGALDKAPLSVAKVSETKGSDSATEREEPSSQGAKPSAQKEEPSSQGPKPSAQKEEPSSQGAKPSAQKEEPSSQGPKPSAQKEEPSSQGPKPSTQGEEPSAQGPAKKPSRRRYRRPQGGAKKAAPTGAAPTGAAPTGAAPTGAAPTGAAPTGAAPTGAAPTGAAPTGAAPTGAAPPKTASVQSLPEQPPSSSPREGSPRRSSLRRGWWSRIIETKP